MSFLGPLVPLFWISGEYIVFYVFVGEVFLHAFC